MDDGRWGQPTQLIEFKVSLLVEIEAKFRRKYSIEVDWQYWLIWKQEASVRRRRIYSLKSYESKPFYFRTMNSGSRED